jgi:hypothetical protein
MPQRGVWLDALDIDSVRHERSCERAGASTEIKHPVARSEIGGDKSGKVSVVIDGLGHHLEILGSRIWDVSDGHDLFIRHQTRRLGAPAAR